MEQKPVHYDGSFHLEQAENEVNVNEPFLMTDEMRKNVGQSPYSIDANE
ncbi:MULTISPECIES: hypothetical protein [Neobacillus]|uniref:Uncharacterized protein n=1 Tax=Neobacillus rhizophilus TaxID=2833579 RepID=A0A942U3C2_9BACI|nr:MULTISPECIES: hypothetical protein [Neobacillus]MBS4212033.1 hypothetical protein [Neobacillus rhizophilus]MBU8915464.1 hypothetical protein [Bacillus sp. FJAT-29953]